MTLPYILFFVFAAIAVVGALLVIFLREPIHSALALILVMVSLAVLYLLLGAEFIAAVQIIVYAGAVMVLFVIVIMLLNAGEEERTNLSKMARYAGLPLGIFLTLDLVYWLSHAALAAPSSITAAGAVAGSVPISDPTRDLAFLLFRSYLFPFELTSIVILIALLGALVLAKRDS
ncbi:MAG: NADH-quinone oxidoreductase subunit J [Candidatus Acidiferrales bacterium]|jgi:NADH-quinone oxidoreductase subunit J